MIQVNHIDQLPANDHERKRTDNLCTYISIVFALVMIGIALIMFSPTYLTKLSYPTDIEGRVCGIDLPQFPYIYQTSLTDPVNIEINQMKKLCVSHCPKQGDYALHCVPAKFLSCKKNNNPFFEVSIYDSNAESPRIGAQCIATDPIIKSQMIAQQGNAGDAQKYRSILNGIKIAAIFAIILSAILYFVIQCFPILVPPKIILLGTIGLGILAILTIFTRVDLFRVVSGFKIFFVVVLILIAIMLLYTLITSPLELQLCAILLRHSSTILSQNYFLIIYIIGFIIATAFVLMLGYFQGLCYIKGDFNNPGIFGKVMFGLLVFEIIWALFFLQSSYNFILSGYGINWYFSGVGTPRPISPLKNLFFYNWGSIIAGAFLTMIFWFPSLVFHYLIPSRNESITSNSCMTKFLFQTCYDVHGLFDLCRAQAFAYINLTGVPYCNSCRYVQYLSQNTGIYTGSKSINRIFLTSSHAFVLSICAIIGVTYLEITQGATSFYMVLLIILISYFFATYLLSLHCYIADGILVTLMTQEYLSGGYQMMIRAPPDLKHQAYMLLNKPVQLQI